MTVRLLAANCCARLLDACKAVRCKRRGSANKLSVVFADKTVALARAFLESLAI